MRTFYSRRFKKKTEIIKPELERYLDRICGTCEEIWVWGHSCGSVDEEYIDALIDRYPNAKWYFSYFNDLDKKKKFAKDKNVVVDKNSFFLLKNQNTKAICDEIISNTGIVELPMSKKSGR